MRTTWDHRFIEALALLCGGNNPPEDMVEKWSISGDERLQSFVGEHSAIESAQAIALIDAAAFIASNPVEGEGHTVERGRNL